MRVGGGLARWAEKRDFSRAPTLRKSDNRSSTYVAKVLEEFNPCRESLRGAQPMLRKSVEYAQNCNRAFLVSKTRVSTVKFAKCDI